jgi:lysophospholipase L1-like esterase
MVGKFIIKAMGVGMIVTIGDSVCWGQRLLDEHKFDRILAERWAGNAADRESENGGLQRLAHSGAILGKETDTSTQSSYPEIPDSYPSIWQQLLIVENWADVDLLLVNGGLNDVSLDRMLDPWIKPEQIEQWTRQYCQAEMARLLTAAAGKVVKPEARIVVLGYYPFLSSETKFDDAKHAQALMEEHGVATGPGGVGKSDDPLALVPAIIDNCMMFWRIAESGLQAAAATANAAAAREVCVFVASGLTEENALWAPESLLWGLTPELGAEDEVKVLRDRACSAEYGNLVHLIAWIRCDHASVGHPDVAGAAKIAETLLAMLGKSRVLMEQRLG